MRKKYCITRYGFSFWLSAFNEGIKNATEYSQVKAYDNQSQVRKYDNNILNIKNRDCIFLLGNQILALENYGIDGDDYRFCFSTLSHIPDMKLLRLEKQKQEKQKIALRNNNLCQYCGGSFKGLFFKVCSKCGKPKDY